MKRQPQITSTKKTNGKQTEMTKTQKPKRYDLEDRTYEFAKKVRGFVKLLPKTTANDVDTRQLLRSSGSVGANYIEANESLSKKDFLHRVKISRKEAKESRYWLQLLDVGGNDKLEKARRELAEEATELLKILNAIATKAQ